MTFELVILFAILTTLALAVYAGRKVFAALMSVAADYKAVSIAQRETLRQLTVANAEAFKLLCNTHGEATTQMVQAHSTVLHDISTSHGIGAAALGGACEQLLSSATIIEQSCTSMATTANAIAKVLNVEFVQALLADVQALKRFVVPGSN